MAAHTGVDLHRGSARGANAFAIIGRRLVSLDHIKSVFLFEIGNGAFQQRGLSGTGRTDKIDRENFPAREPGPVARRQRVVLGQDTRFQFLDIRGLPMSSMVMDMIVAMVMSMMMIVAVAHAICMNVLMRMVVSIMIVMMVVMTMMVVMGMVVMVMIVAVVMIMAMPRTVGMNMLMRVVVSILRDNGLLAGLQIQHGGFRLAGTSAMSAHQTISCLNTSLIISIVPFQRDQQIRGNCSPTSMSTMRLPPNTVFITTRPGSPSPTWPINAAFSPSG